MKWMKWFIEYNNFQIKKSPTEISFHFLWFYFQVFQFRLSEKRNFYTFLWYFSFIESILFWCFFYYLLLLPKIPKWFAIEFFSRSLWKIEKTKKRQPSFIQTKIKWKKKFVQKAELNRISWLRKDVRQVPWMVGLYVRMRMRLFRI